MSNSTFAIDHFGLPWHRAESMTIERIDDRLVVDRTFPNIIQISDELEAIATGPHIRRARDFLVFRLANGAARYRLLGRRRSPPLPGVPGPVEPRRGESLWQLEHSTYTPVPSSARSKAAA